MGRADQRAAARPIRRSVQAAVRGRGGPWRRRWKSASKAIIAPQLQRSAIGGCLICPPRTIGIETSSAQDLVCRQDPIMQPKITRCLPLKIKRNSQELGSSTKKGPPENGPFHTVLIASKRPTFDFPLLAKGQVRHKQERGAMRLSMIRFGSLRACRDFQTLHHSEYTQVALMRVLFVCTANRLRSPTAEDLFKNWAGVEAEFSGYRS